MPAAKDLSGLSEEERSKLALKRQKNKEAAQKCRAKKQAHIDLLEKQVAEQMKTNEDLRLRITHLEAMLEVQANAVGKPGVVPKARPLGMPTPAGLSVGNLVKK
mmetsp:Transcript_67683/g.94113  ORF Transcript_67683/g.94113 Transcript_67683/m.94113 type:complete len:104 (-) Transcript_67683:152-463(-)